MSDVLYYANLLANESRVGAFKRAIHESVRPGDRVLDLGTGIGTYAFFAARAGAGAVWGVDLHPVVHVAEQIALANGLADRVTFLRGRVPEIALPPRIDVLIFEDFSCTLMDTATHRILRSVLETSLAPGGRMVPVAARLSVAPVQSETQHRKAFPLDDQAGNRFDLDWTLLRPLLANMPRRDKLAPGDLLAVPLRSSVVPLLPLPGPDRLSVTGSWEAATPGRIHALAMWFDLEVSSGNWISNEPGPKTEPWGQWILPVDPPLEVEGPGRVHASVGREVLPDGGHGWLTWQVRWNDEVRLGHEFAGLALGLADVASSREELGGKASTKES